MKKIFMLLTIFAMAFFVVACSKDDDKNKNKNGSITVAYRQIFTIDVDRLILASGQRIELKAFVRKANGNIIPNAAVNWTLSPGLGTLTQSHGDSTVLVVNASTGEEHFIKAELDGIEKKIPITIDILTVSFHLKEYGNSLFAGAVNDIKVRLNRSNGEEDKNSKIAWYTKSGNYTEQFTLSDEWNGYSPVAGLTGNIKLEVVVNGKVYESEEYAIVEE